MRSMSLPYVLVREGLSTDDVGVARGAPFFRRCGRELVSKPAISLKKSWRGYRRMTLHPPADGAK